MKPLFFFLFVLSAVLAYGQNNFECYAYQGKYGVVNISSLEETVPPVYDYQYNRLNTFLCFREKGKTLLYSKLTGIKEEYTTPQEEDYFYFNSTRYLHVLDEKHSILVEQESGSKYILPFRYHSIAAANNGFIIAYKEGQSDVYSRGNLKKPYLSIKGNYSFTDNFRNRKNGTDPVSFTVIYGDEETYVYDQCFKLVRKYPAAASRSAAVHLMSEDYSIDDGGLVSPPMDVPYNHWTREIRNSDSSVYRNRSTGITIKVNGDGYISSGFGQDWLTLSITLPEKISARFRIDVTNGKILLPLKYQKALGLELR